MFYIQTQDGDLPYVYKVYKTYTGAKKAALKFMRDNADRGMISVVTGTHNGVLNLLRNERLAPIIEEKLDPDTGKLVETIFH